MVNLEFVESRLYIFLSDTCKHIHSHIHLHTCNLQDNNQGSPWSVPFLHCHPQDNWNMFKWTIGVKRKCNGLYLFHLTNHEEDNTFVVSFLIGEIWQRGLFFSLKIYLMKLLNEAGKRCTIGYINTSVGKWALAKKF